MSTQFRFPGPKAFTSDQQALFYGRENEIRYLYELIDLKKITVLFGKSGTGKSSLLNAGVVPKLRNKENYQEAVIRMLYKGSQTFSNTPTGNYLVANIVQHFPLNTSIAGKYINRINYTSDILWWHFKQLQAQDENKKYYLLIFDQFEELGSHPRQLVADFLKQINDLLNFPITAEYKKALLEGLKLNPQILSKEELALLYEPIRVKLIVIIKSEKMGLLHSVKNYIPDILQNCYELNPLNSQQARMTIEEPAKTDNIPAPKFMFQPQAVDKILEFVQESTDDTFYESPGIQTSLLQMICSQIERDIVPRDPDKEISVEDLPEMKKLTEDYYNGNIERLVLAENIDKVTEILLRDFIETKLISHSQGETIFREQVFTDRFPIELAALKANDFDILNKLVDAGFLRKDKKIEGEKERFFYEISHEKLLEPILNTRNARLQPSPKIQTGDKKEEKTAQQEGSKKSYVNLPENGKTTGETFTSKDPHAYLRKANELSYAGKYDEAIIYFDKSIELNPKYFHAYYLRGSLHLENGKYQAAIADFEKTLTLSPDYFEAHNEIGRCYLRQNKYNEAEKQFRKVLKHDNKAYYAANNIGLVFYNQGQYKESIPHFTEALRLNPSFYNSYYYRGVAYGLIKAYGKALLDFDELEKLQPDNFQLFYGRGLCYYDMIEDQNYTNNATDKKKYCEQAIIQLSKALALDPSSSSARYYRALTYEKIPDYQNALQDYLNLLAANPSNVEAWYGKGLCSYYLENYSEATKDFNKVLELEPNKVNAIFELGRIFYKQGELDEAIKKYTEVVSRKADYHEAYYNRGLCYYFSKKYENAIEDFTEVTSINPDYSSGYYQRALTFEVLKDYEAAIKDYSAVIKLEKNPPDAFYGRAYSYMQAHHYREAIPDFEESIRLKSETGQSLTWNLAYLGFCYQKTDPPDFNKAMEFHRKAYHSDPKNAWNAGNLGYCFQKTDPPDFRQALAYHLVAYELDPMDGWNTRNLAYCYQKTEPPDFNKALEYHTKAFHSEPKNAWNASNLGYCYQKIDPPDFKEALKYHLQAYELDPNNEWNNTNIGYCYQNQTPPDFEKALYYLLAAEQINPKDAWTLGKIGYCFQKSIPPDFEKAFSYHSKSFDLDPDDVWNKINLGWCLFVRGEPAKSKQLLKEALPLSENENRGDCQIILGHIAVVENNWKDAAMLYQEGMKTYSNKEEFGKICFEEYKYLESKGVDKIKYEQLIQELVKKPEESQIPRA